MHSKQLNLSVTLLLLAVAFATSSVSAFLPNRSHHGAAAASYHTSHQPSMPRDEVCSSVHSKTRTILQMDYKSPDEANSYNDDAFGLVFITGGIISKDVDFVGTFLALSAIAATSTNAGFIEKDDRAPAAVALLTLLITPVVSSLRQTGSLESMTPPMTVEIGLCAASAIWAFVNWSRVEES